MIDLSLQAGFPLQLDPQRPDVVFGGDVRFIRQTRLVSDMERVLLEPASFPSSQPLYWNYKLEQAGGSDDLFRDMHLTFGLMLLPSLKVGVEYIKTHGHYHSCFPGSRYEYPEVYTHYFGSPDLLLQRRRSGSTLELDDCVVYKMIPGRSIMIPPGYAHIIINPSEQPVLMAGLYSTDAGHLYEPILETAGGAYFLIDKAGQNSFIPNPRYTHIPPLREIVEITGTRFAPPDAARSLWQSFVSEPELYAFINDPEKAALQFSPEDLIR